MYRTLQELEEHIFRRKSTRLASTLYHVEKAYRILKEKLLSDGYYEPIYIQVLGTNGKGSTSTFIAGLSKEYGYCTGLFLSPHIISIRERIQINSNLSTEAEWLEASSYIEKCCDVTELVFFEYIFLLAIYIFAVKGVDIAIMEAGLGGQYDATSILPTIVQCFTPIQIDHEHILGRTFEEIAMQKALAINAKSILCSAPQEKSVQKIVEQCAGREIYYSRERGEYPIQLAGEHQQKNADLAYTVWRQIANLLAIPLSEVKTNKAFSTAYIAGRLQKIILPTGLELIIDSAHNYGGLVTIKKYFSDKTLLAVIYSTVYRESLKEINTIIHSIARDAPIYYYTMKTPRAVTYNEYLQICSIKEEKNSIHPCYSIRDTIENLYKQYTTGTVLLCGSIYFVGDFFKEYPEYYLSNNKK